MEDIKRKPMGGNLGLEDEICGIFGEMLKRLSALREEKVNLELERMRLHDDAMNVEGDDRLSNLPDYVIHEILSYISIKDAIRTSVLSSRWRFIWTKMPYLNFENLNHHRPSISKFISNVLSHRNEQTQVISVDLVLGRSIMDDESVARILNCAYSYNIQQLGEHLISAPRLTSLVIEGRRPWHISIPEGFPCLEKVDLFMHKPSNADARGIVSLLHHLRNAKLLILSLGILQRLLQRRKHSSYLELMPHEACAFANAKISKFRIKNPAKIYLEKVTTSTEIETYESCPTAIFPMVSYEEIKAIQDMTSAQVHVENLGMWLNKCKENKNMKEPQVKKHWPFELQSNLGEIMALMKQSKLVALRSWRILAKLEFLDCYENKDISRIISWLQEMRSLFQGIEGMMIRLSATKRAVMQPNFTRLFQDAAILTYNILEWMKTRRRKEVVGGYERRRYREEDEYPESDLSTPKDVAMDDFTQLKSEIVTVPMQVLESIAKVCHVSIVSGKTLMSDSFQPLHHDSTPQDTNSVESEIEETSVRESR
ncbi:hypothetical protein L2E82_43522 [Cichorium intybus]|uniref:Uncharacterized protein n=1 Tax=Cichorium intybus TaxID=13427 RepID=A0ACB8ZP16_CICIN|nr:hypothetical protein L2E82_43522 [Cichorium intybus]